ncbi:glycosyltransferase family 2 protein [Sphingobacterium sp. SGG-5]|uniref:glycosyltransferase family 2 protein n=1 Tax=Sphingobacterium sp. SGG-5 TaxID=2710881 RepID=UPI0013EB0F94|nr:glycosyltransferase family 2 protein [Sphingobacterium sp. SGG-5]NGM61559.1 glycosyltransferase family 2 protein [Sphingobacterium sp. SGG-5]
MRTEYPKVAVVILNWDGRFFLEKFLPSVYNSTYPNIEFVLGDNASTDDSVDFVRKTYPNITIIQNPSNYGFAGGYNRILEHVGADYFILLNSDVEVTPGWIEPMIQLMEQEGYAAVQPKIKSYHQKTHFEHAGAAGGAIDTFGYPFCRGRILHICEEDQGQYDQNAEVFWASGAALCIKSTAWQEVGGFDEDFFAHMEEVDLCWRLKKLGYKIGYAFESTVYHVGGGTLKTSNPRKTYLNFRNNLMMLQKNLSFGQAFLILQCRLWLDLFAIIRFLFEGKRRDAWAVSRAHQSFCLHFFRTAAKRKKPRTPENKTGKYKKCIIWDFYINKIHTYRGLREKDFY